MNPPLSLFPEWNDESRISTLFAPLPPSRESHPARWDSHMKFWRRAIFAHCLSNGRVVVKNSDSQKFRAKGMVPIGFPGILSSLETHTNVLSPLNSYENEGSMLWKVWDGFVSPLRNAIAGPPQSEGSWVCTDALKAFAMAAIAWNKEQIASGASFDGDVHPMKELVEVSLHGNGKSDPDAPDYYDVGSWSCKLNYSSWNLVLREIERLDAGKVIHCDGEVGIKFKSHVVSSPSSSSLSSQTSNGERDETVLKLRNLLLQLQNQQKALEEKASECVDAIRQIISSNSMAAKRGIARNHIKRKNMLLSAADRISGYVTQIEGILLGVLDAETQVQVHSAMKSGKDAMKQSLAQLDVDDVQSTIDDVRDMMSDIDSVSTIIAEGAHGNGNEVEVDELERELQSLIEADREADVASGLLEGLSIGDGDNDTVHVQRQSESTTATSSSTAVPAARRQLLA